MTITELRENRKTAWDAAKAFVETKRDKDGLLSDEDAKTYAEMEKKIRDYTAEIERVEQMDENGNSLWATIEKKWIDTYKNRDVIPGFSARHMVTGNDEWLCEAYMETDYTTLTQDDFQQTVNDYLAYLVKTGVVYEN